jgi:hypothetical protein
MLKWKIATVFGVAFGSLLISHQTSIFVSIMRRTASQITDVADADIWVMNARTQSIDDVRPLNDRDLSAIRGVVSPTRRKLPSSSAVKSDKMDPSGTRDSAQGSGSGNASATTAGGATGGPAGAGSSNAIKNGIVGSSKEPARR